MSLDAALAFIAASYVVPETPAMPPRVVRARRAAVALATLAPKSSAPSDNGGKAEDVTSTHTIPAPAIGSLSAVGFFEAVRNAGRRPRLDQDGQVLTSPSGQPVMMTDPSKVREDETIAIGAFVGYDRQAPHGSQLDAAKRRALQEIRPVKAGEGPRGTAPTVAGYVSGMPDEQSKIVQDLLARERLAAEEMATQYKLADDATRKPEERSLARGLAAVEKARIEEIRKDLANMGA